MLTEWLLFTPRHLPLASTHPCAGRTGWLVCAHLWGQQCSQPLGAAPCLPLRSSFHSKQHRLSWLHFTPFHGSLPADRPQRRLGSTPPLPSLIPYRLACLSTHAILFSPRTFFSRQPYRVHRDCFRSLLVPAHNKASPPRTTTTHAPVHRFSDPLRSVPHRIALHRIASHPIPS